jgi:hypothetical protein
MMERLTDSRLYGNKYSVTDMLTDLTNAVFKEDLNGNVNTFRQNLQLLYVKRLVSMTDNGSYDDISRANAWTQLNQIRQWVSAAPAPGVLMNAETKAHRLYLANLIKRAFEH